MNNLVLKYEEKLIKTLTITFLAIWNNTDNSISSSTQTIVLLAAEHRDDVIPTSLYYNVNVEGTQNVLDVMDKKGIKRFDLGCQII